MDEIMIPDRREERDISSFEKALAYAIGEKKSRETTEKLLDRYGSFATVFSAGEGELSLAGDINISTALMIKLMAYISSRRITDSFTFGEDHDELELCEYIGALFLGLSVETVYALFLDDKNRVIHTELINEGTVNTSDVVPRKILESARRHKSNKIILAHNHPKGGISPSKDDIMTTGRLFNLFATVGVRLCAHYIVADGMVGRIESDMLYDPDYKS